MQVFSVILSGGTGSRMNREEPKQFLKIKGKTVLAHSVLSFLQINICRPFVIVCNPDFKKKTIEVISQETSLILNQDFVVIEGGKTRHLSTLKGIAVIIDNDIACDENAYNANDVIMIHDAARPVIQQQELVDLRDLFQDKNCEIASLVGEVTETILEVNEGRNQISRGLNRNQLVSIKTPQAVRFKTIQKMIKQNTKTEFTDLLSFGLACGIKGKVADCAPSNIKLTRPEDVSILEDFL